MSRKSNKPVFKPYIQHQDYLLPRSYDEVIEPGNLVRVVNDTINKLDLSALVRKYKGGGTSSYHPQMLLKVLVYAYCRKLYPSRKIAAALRENIHFMWLSGGQTPDFRTINDFRGKRMKDITQTLFAEVLAYLVEAGYVKLEVGFVDGTKIEADANKHKVVWAKRKETYQKRVREQIQELLTQIEQENEAEQAEYGERDLEERGGPGGGQVNAEQLEKKIAEINQKLNEQTRPKAETKAARAALKKLKEDCLPRLAKYEQQTQTLHGRSSYSQTDPEASCMRMKEDRGAENPGPSPPTTCRSAPKGSSL